MNEITKKEILDKLVITDKTKEFLSKMVPNHGNLVKNTRKKIETEPDFVGWARLTNGTVLRLEGNVRAEEGKVPSVPLLVVEVPGHLIGEEEEIPMKIPRYKSKTDEFLGLQ